MTTETQDAGAATNEAGGEQKVDAAAVAATAGEGKADAVKTAEATGETKTEAQAEVDVTFNMPEGIELDSASADAFKAVLKDKALTEPQRYQKLADLAVEREQARFDAHKAQVEKWTAEVAADKELGKPENQAVAVKVVNDFGTPELKEMLDRSGLGNHPELVKFALKIGKAISEDSIVNGRAPTSSGARDAASVLYGSSTP